MGNAAIVCESLGKCYRLGARPTNSMREALMTKLSSSFMRSKKPNGARPTSVWALRDVSFEVKHGEVVGLIGRNGAGKSTVLKLLSRITEPTEGRTEVRGRVGSLLEVGTGFHQELTGRENIYLSGAILGMGKAEIQRKFDEIVDFAEISDFLDTAVKRYSSGMYVRLAFAVAVHLTADILLVDEVLAVGDAQFQKKCFERVRNIGNTGRTIIFVSHNMAALRQVCSRGIILDHGRVQGEGNIDEVADRYLASVDAPMASGLDYETPSCILRDVSIRSLTGPVIKTCDRVEVRVRFTTKTALRDPGLYVCFQGLDNSRIAGVISNDLKSFPSVAAGETLDMGFVIEDLPLLPGTYNLEVQFRDASEYKFEFVPTLFRFDVVETPVYGGAKVDHWLGSVALKASPWLGAVSVR